MSTQKKEFGYAELNETIGIKIPASLKVFIQEDDEEIKRDIMMTFKKSNYAITFFSKSDSVFDLLNFNPHIIIQDYQKGKVVKCYQWDKCY